MKKKLLEALIKCRKIIDTGLHTGICYPVRQFFLCIDARTGMTLHNLFKRWPKWSGLLEYPVPAPSDFVAKDAGDYAAAAQAYDMLDSHWDSTTEYGQLRIELLEFCIATLEEEIANEQVSVSD